MTATAGDATARETPADPTATAPSAAVWFGIGLFALVHLGLLVVPGGPAPVVLAAVDGLLLAVVAGVEYRFGAGGGRSIAVFAFVTAVLLTGTWLAAAGGDLAVVTIGFVAVAALASYFLHRYELVVLGLVEVPDERE